MSIFSHHEYAGLITITENQKENKNSVGRKQNGAFKLTNDHQLKDTQVQKLRSKFCVPIAI